MLVGVDYLESIYGPAVPPPQNLDELREFFTGDFPSYRKDPHKKGLVILDREWVNENLVTEWFPLLGMRTVHRELVVPLFRAMSRVAASPHSDYIKPRECGTFIARFKGWNPRRTLSIHSFGLAVDLNWNDNPYGSKGNIDPWIVNVMKEEGFDWGGDWRTPDGMHFQYCHRLISLPKSLEVK